MTIKKTLGRRYELEEEGTGQGKKGGFFGGGGGEKEAAEEKAFEERVQEPLKTGDYQLQARACVGVCVCVRVCVSVRE